MVSMSLVPLVSMSLVVMVSLGVVDVGNVSLVAIHMVLDSLEPAIGQVDMVTPAGMLAVPLLIVAKLCAMVGVMDIIAIFVVDRMVMVVAVAMIRLCTNTDNSDCCNDASSD